MLRTAEAVKVVDEVNMQLAVGAHSSSSTLLELAPAAPSVPDTVGLSVKVGGASFHSVARAGASDVRHATMLLALLASQREPHTVRHILKRRP